MRNCSNCERRFKEKTNKRGCQVFSKFPENCWAWTDDPEWENKVKKEIEAYSKYQGMK